MDLFAEFSKRRGDAPPPPSPAATVRPLEPQTLKQLIHIAEAGRLRDSYLLEVNDRYQAVIGSTHVILCPDEEEAQRRQKQRNMIAFYPDELLVMMRTIVENPDKATGILAAKRTFCGIVSW